MLIVFFSLRTNNGGLSAGIVVAFHSIKGAWSFPTPNVSFLNVRVQEKNMERISFLLLYSVQWLQERKNANKGIFLTNRIRAAQRRSNGGVLLLLWAGSADLEDDWELTCITEQQ